MIITTSLISRSHNNVGVQIYANYATKHTSIRLKPKYTHLEQLNHGFTVRKSPSFPRNRSATTVVTPRAALWLLPDDIVSTLHTGITLGIAVSIGLSALPILTGDSKERNERRYYQPTAEESQDTVKWSVMSVLSLIPLVNPMSWVFAALDDEDSSALYYFFAFLYALPYLSNGVQLDAFTFFTVAACAAHVQVERVAQTEPVEVELPSALRALLKAIPSALTGLARYGVKVGEEVSDRTRKAEDARRRRPDRKYLEEKSREARAELEEFDRKQRQKERQRQGSYDSD